MRFIAPILILVLLFPPRGFAEEPRPPTIMGIAKGEKAPFNGVLLNETAAAQMFVDRDFTLEECKLKIDFQLGKERAKYDLQNKNIGGQRIHIEWNKSSRLNEFVKQDVKCYHCQRRGHFARDCKYERRSRSRSIDRQERKKHKNKTPGQDSQGLLRHALCAKGTVADIYIYISYMCMPVSQLGSR